MKIELYENAHGVNPHGVTISPETPVEEQLLRALFPDSVNVESPTWSCRIERTGNAFTLMTTVASRITGRR